MTISSIADDGWCVGGQGRSGVGRWSLAGGAWWSDGEALYFSGQIDVDYLSPFSAILAGRAQSPDKKYQR
jgi:hypothetical protein